MCRLIIALIGILVLVNIPVGVLALDSSVQEYMNVLRAHRGSLDVFKDEDGIRYYYTASIYKFRIKEKIEDEVVKDRLKDKGYIEIFGIIEKPYLSESIRVYSDPEKREIELDTVNFKLNIIRLRGQGVIKVDEDGNIEQIYPWDKKLDVEKILKEGKIWYSKAKIILGVDTLEGFKRAYLPEESEG